MKLFIQSIVALFLTWILSAFVVGVGNPFLWTESHRGIYVLLTVAFVVIYNYHKKYG